MGGHLGVALWRQLPTADICCLIGLALFFGGTGHQATLLEVKRTFIGTSLKMADHRHGNDPIPIGQLDAPHTGGFSARKHPHFCGAEADRAAQRGDQHHVILFRGNARIHQADTFGQIHRDLAVAHHIREIRQPVPSDIPS